MARRRKAKAMNSNDGEEHAPNPSVVTEKITEFLSSEQAISVTDVSLITCDGVRIPAIRALLIIRSPFFEKLFTSDFVEKSSSEVHISLCATPLRHVLEFIYTDDCAWIRYIRRTQLCHWVYDFELDGVIELALAADYIQVPKLLQWCTDVLLWDMERKSSSLFFNLRKLNGFSATWARSIKEFAFRTLIAKPSFPQLADCDTSEVIAGVLSLDDDTLEGILKQAIPNSRTKEEALFQILLVWTNRGCEVLESFEVFVDVSKMNLSQSDRLPTAKRIAQRFDLTKFSAKVLYEVVERSGICNADDILRACRGFALNAEQNGSHIRCTSCVTNCKCMRGGVEDFGLCLVRQTGSAVSTLSRYREN